jgi:hypothetical protein
MQAHRGDEIVIEPLQVGGHRRIGQVLQVLGRPGHERYRIRWDDDGHESIFFPSSGSSFVHVNELLPKRIGRHAR